MPKTYAFIFRLITNITVHGNAVLALGYIALVHRKLEKNAVESVMLPALRDPEAEFRALAADAVDDLNQYMNWQISGRGI